MGGVLKSLEGKRMTLFDCQIDEVKSAYGG
jgi:hypothetical protein